MEAAHRSRSGFKAPSWKIWLRFDIKEHFCDLPVVGRTLNCNCVLLLMRLTKNTVRKKLFLWFLTSERGGGGNKHKHWG